MSVGYDVMITLTLETHLVRGRGPLRSMQMIATFSPNMLSKFVMKMMVMMMMMIMMMMMMITKALMMMIMLIQMDATF